MSSLTVFLRMYCTLKGTDCSLTVINIPGLHHVGQIFTHLPQSYFTFCKFVGLPPPWLGQFAIKSKTIFKFCNDIVALEQYRPVEFWISINTFYLQCWLIFAIYGRKKNIKGKCVWAYLILDVAYRVATVGHFTWAVLFWFPFYFTIFDKWSRHMTLNLHRHRISAFSEGWSSISETFSSSPYTAANNCLVSSSTFSHSQARKKNPCK